jgi:glycosyltransferase involved in cell wall biosynthesis
MEDLEINSAPLPIPLVSVSITAYNLANWLPRALDSVLEQRTTFPIEIVIGDDCSQDATLSVAHSYRERHPDLIRVLERSRNVGVQRNTYDNLEQCKGKYVAFLDGDDYWTDPEKLAIQVKTLESDPSINLCCHPVRYVTHDGKVKRDRAPSLSDGRYGLEEIVRGNFISTPSVMFRSGVHRKLPEWYFDFQSLSDWPLWVLSALSGDIVFLDRVMTDVMSRPGSSFLSKGPLFRYTMDAQFYEQIESILPSKWHRLARAEKGKRYESIAYLLRKQGDFAASRDAAFKSFLSPFLMDNVGSKTKALLASLVREAEWRLKGRPPAPNK